LNFIGEIKMTLNQRIFDLMEVEPEDHNMDWLKRGLQAAIEVEFFTIPPYLAALWSIKDEAHPAYESISKIVIFEEMLHFGLMCNLLTGIGEVPKINARANVPTYPHNLPGNINPNLTVELRGLSDDALDKFMAIELPENGSIVESASATMMALNEEFSTIGAFYTAILEAFERLQPQLSATNQKERLGFGLVKITDLVGVRDAIGTIKRQGEGANGLPEDHQNDLAHFYRFGELRFRKTLKQDAAGKWHFNGDDVDFPGVHLMAVVPEGGYRSEDVSSPEVQTLLETFDRNYSNMLELLQAAWQGGSLGSAVGAMRSLKQPAVELMTKEIAPGKGNYGPCFRLV
jgi:Ferritin-like